MDAGEAEPIEEEAVWQQAYRRADDEAHLRCAGPAIASSHPIPSCLAGEPTTQGTCSCLPLIGGFSQSYLNKIHHGAMVNVSRPTSGQLVVSEGQWEGKERGPQGFKSLCGNQKLLFLMNSALGLPFFSF